MYIALIVAQQKRYKLMVMFFTIQERLPFWGLVAVSWFIPSIGPKIALFLTISLLIWQGYEGDLTVTAWQTMIGKIIARVR
ncbi:MAG: hypothetical protein WAM09_17005 [Anaerolineales bacterium]